MKGYVDESNRALIRIRIGLAWDDLATDVEAWVDTGFNGFLVLPKPLIDRLMLFQESSSEVILADGTTQILETFACYADWQDGIQIVQVFASSGPTALLGTELLADSRWMIDYVEGIVEIE